ncbi:MAG: serine/threonine protein kinase, partial [Terracidiphilus sp.]
RQGVIHRDIKPANILMTSREVYGAERPRITDFGIAKLSNGGITTTGQLLGTPSFMPPEQFTGSPIDGRADLFSLGVILYSLATGEQPFPGETMTAVSYKVVHTLPAPPSKLNPAIPALLESVILKCLAKSPAERYQSGEELAQDLAAVRAHCGATTLNSMPPPQAALLDSNLTLAPNARSFPPRQGMPATNGAPARASAADTVAGAGMATGARAFARRPEIRRLGVIAITAVALIAVALMVRTWLGGHSAAHEAAPTNPSASAGAKIAKPAPGVFAALQPVTAKPDAAHPATAPPAAKPATPAFNPKNLDPKTSAKLKVELKHVPDGLGFIIEMNSRPYLRTVSGDKRSLEDLFVPPGIQEFSVVYVSAGQQKSTIS